MIGRFARLGVYRDLVRSWEFYRVSLAGLLALASYLWDHGQESQSTAGIIFALASIILNGVPIIWGAIVGILQKRVNVDELVSIAIIAAIIKGEFLAAAVISFVMVLGALIEEATSNSARKAIQALIEISPETATIICESGTKEIPANQVQVGNIVLVKPGQRIPVDGIITKGITAVDESSMTGEPIPKEKTVEDEVYAGTLNQNGVIEIETNRIGENTTLGKVIKLVSEAEAHKPEIIRSMDRYARWFTPTILVCAVAAWALTGNIDRGITVLIVGCPCALILAAPTAIIASIGRIAKEGILVKGGQFLEETGKSEVVLFDKTGTVTEGKPKIDEIITAEGVTAKQVLAYAASVEQHSTHPLAYAVLKAAEEEKVDIEQPENTIIEIGLGIKANINGKIIEVGSAYIGGGSMQVPDSMRKHLERFKNNGATPLVVYQDRQLIGILSVADHIRPLATECIRNLKNLGIKRIGVLSGDHEKSVELITKSVGITEFWANLKPQDKFEIIKDFQNSHNVVLFVGDGINDGPALTCANVGIAMGTAGSDIALETADIVLMNDDITKIPFVIRLSRTMLKTIKWNIAFGMFFNAIAVLAGGIGLLTPILGAIAHNFGSVLVVLSSARLAIIRAERL